MPGVERPPGLSSLVTDEELEFLRGRGYSDKYIVDVAGPLIEERKQCSPSGPRPNNQRGLTGKSPPLNPWPGELVEQPREED